MDTPYAFVKIGIDTAVDTGKAFGFIADSVGVDKVNNDPQPQPVSGIDQLFELLRSSETVGNGKKVGNVIAETGIIGVIHHCHQLQRVVIGFCNTGQDIFLKLFESADFFLLLSHSDVGFVDQCPLRTGRCGVLENIRFFRIPDDGGKEFGVFILTDFSGVGREPQP